MTTPKNTMIYQFVINSFNTGSIQTNLRPRDENSIGHDEVFLQPDDHPTGIYDPTGNISVYTYSSFISEDGISKERREYWIFYGYNDVDTGLLRGSHQGDWERVTLKIANGKIEGAWLDQHGESVYYGADDLNVKEVNGVQILKVYSARGTHPIYNEVGQFDRESPLISHDHTADGYQWEITKKTESLNSQPWILYAGAWGEVGMTKYSTGPLGPWYKVMRD